MTHTARGRGANPCGKLGVLRTMEEGRAAFLLLFCCQSSKVSPPRRVSPTAHRSCMPVSCPASPPASRALRACFPVRPRLRGRRSLHSCARGVCRLTCGTRDCAGSPSATTHDIACAFATRDSQNSSLALTEHWCTVRRPGFHGDPRMTKDDFFFGSGRRVFCVPPDHGHYGPFSSEARASPAPPSLAVSSPCCWRLP